jgi:hypothetical protein
MDKNGMQPRSSWQEVREDKTQVWNNTMAPNANKLSSALDTVAHRLEAAGLMKEAVELDVLANTIEAFE